MTEEYSLSTIRSSRYREIGDRPPSLAAVEAVASLRDVDPTEMVDSLYDYVDPDALDTLIADSTGGPVSVEFQMGDQVVGLWNDGRLAVNERVD